MLMDWWMMISSRMLDDWNPAKDFLKSPADLLAEAVAAQKEHRRASAARVAKRAVWLLDGMTYTAACVPLVPVPNPAIILVPPQCERFSFANLVVLVCVWVSAAGLMKTRRQAAGWIRTDGALTSSFP